MNKRSKKMLFITLIGMFISGFFIYVLETFFLIETDYGLRANPFIEEVKLIHNVFNFLFLFAVGRIYDVHIRLGLVGVKREGRFSGFIMFLFIGALTVSGCLMLYLGDEKYLSILGDFHFILGGLLFMTFLVHYLLRVKLKKM